MGGFSLMLSLFLYQSTFREPQTSGLMGEASFFIQCVHTALSFGSLVRAAARGLSLRSYVLSINFYLRGDTYRRVRQEGLHTGLL